MVGSGIREVPSEYDLMNKLVRWAHQHTHTANQPPKAPETELNVSVVKRDVFHLATTATIENCEHDIFQRGAVLHRLLFVIDDL